MTGENQQYDISPGMMLGGRYQIAKMIGKGGMALVYQALDIKTGRQVAIKVLKPEISHDEEFVRRFDTEAKAASSLSHANIVKVIGVGEERGIRYMVQEFVEGSTLKDLIDEYGSLDWRIAVPIGLQIALALEHAHAAGVVHRDIKPQNIMITPDRTALVTDFGIARASTANTITLTSGNAMGSVHYFSPEQARGGMVGPSADIYSLGILFYEMLTGEVPFDGETSVAVAIKHLQEEPLDPRTIVNDIPDGLAAIVMKCIQKNPKQRYRDARELIEEIDAFTLNPNGIYGQIAADSRISDPTTNNSALRPQADYEKIRDIEESIHIRRRSRQRENGVIIALILVFMALVISVGAFVMSRLGGGNPTESTELSDYIVPSFVGMTRDEAINQLRDDEIEFDVREEPSATIPTNEIISQTPIEGAVISRSGLQKVILFVSTGDGTLKLGNYVGMNFLEAEIEIRNGLNYAVRVIREENGEFAPDTVIRTEPAAGGIPPDGEAVILYVSQGPTEVQIPANWIGLARELVMRNITDFGLEIENISITGPDPRLPAADQYLVAIEPGVGEMIRKGDSVTLVFSDYAFLNPSPTPEETTTEETTTEETTSEATTEATTEPPATSTAPATSAPTSEPAATTAAPVVVTTPSVATPTPVPSTTAPETAKPTPPSASHPTTTAAPAEP